MAKPMIKWPGGKSSELDQFISYIPSFRRYIEPFFGGGALYFHIAPKEAEINDISESLMDFYVLLREGDEGLQRYLYAYDDSFQGIQDVAENHYEDLLQLFQLCMDEPQKKADLLPTVSNLIDVMSEEILALFTKRLILDYDVFFQTLATYVTDKLIRTAANHQKSPMKEEDIAANLITGFTSGYYMYFRGVYNDWLLNRAEKTSMSYRAANFYFIREYCYGSMFRYNAKGEFNIPYGGISYNRKNLRQKIANMFANEITDMFAKTHIYSQDFETFFETIKPGKDDFMFLDPPYDTDFSDYEGNAFTHEDHERLAAYLKQTEANFILVIKNTDFIWNLYKDGFWVLHFHNQYLYNVRQRNDREAEHLIITNMPIPFAEEN